MRPSKIGHYRIESKLGTGGMGEVYRAIDEHLGRDVAIKRISDPMAKKGRERERLRREAQAVARLRHPTIVRLLGFFENDDGHWLVMELVEGRSLTRLLRDEGPLEPGSAVALFHQVAGALAEAHEHGILHRDLKADNLMVTPGGRAKLLDFGLALPIQSDPDESRLTLDGRILGTPHAMSPEQARGWDLDHRSDLFSLGTLLYEALSGTKPFLGSDPMESLRRVCFQHQKPLRKVDPRISRELSWLVDRLLEKEPRQRPQESRKVVEALARLLDPEAGRGAPERGSSAARPAGRGEAPPTRVDPRDLDLLHDLWRRAAAGEGHVVLVSGRANAGKSRMVAAFQRGVRSREMTWLACRCSPFETSAAFAPLLDLLRRLVEVRAERFDGSETEGRIAALETLLGPHAVSLGVVPVVAEMLELRTSSAEPISALTAEDLRRKILETFLGWLQELAEERPAVVVFEEVQWADPATLELLAELVEPAATLPVLLLLTSQPDFRPPWGPRPHFKRRTVGI